MTRFWLFLHKYPNLERQISGCEWEKYEPSIGTKISKKLRYVGWSKQWSGHGPLSFIRILNFSVFNFSTPITKTDEWLTAWLWDICWQDYATICYSRSIYVSHYTINNYFRKNGQVWVLLIQFCESHMLDNTT